MAKALTELVAWQLARELKLTVYELVKRPPAASDEDFVRQISDSAASGPRNIAEGFARFNRREFAQFLKIAIASEEEVRNHFIDAFDKGYVSADERDAKLQLGSRAIGAAVRLRRYLLSKRNPYS